MEKIITTLLVLVGIIHLLPAVGMLGAERLNGLYGVLFDDSNLFILIRHRAVLFGLLGLFILYAAFKPSLQPLAFLAGFVSVISFLAIALSVGGYNNAISKIVIADVVAAIALCIALLLVVTLMCL